jgi:DNA-binding protein HU-beta
MVGWEDGAMNKEELVARIASSTGLTKRASSEAVEAVFEAITEALTRGDRVQLTGFGTFEVRDRRARAARNPQTGTPIRVPATRAPAFRAGKTLKDSVVAASKPPGPDVQPPPPPRLEQ